MIVYIDGKYKNLDEASAQAYSPGNLWAAGVFETFLVLNGTPVHWEDHYDRFNKGMKYFGISLRHDNKRIVGLIKAVADRNGLKNARVRICVWKEKARVRFMVAAFPLSGRSEIKNCKVCVSLRLHPQKRHSHLKTLFYLDFKKANEEAAASGFHEAVLLNKHGMIIEGSRTNIFFVKKDQIITPPVKSGCLNGVTRKKIIALVRNLGYNCIIKNIACPQINSYSEVFLTNAVLGVVPVANIGKTTFSSCKRDSLSWQIKNTYDKSLSKKEF